MRWAKERPSVAHLYAKRVECAFQNVRITSVENTGRRQTKIALKPAYLGLEVLCSSTAMYFWILPLLDSIARLFSPPWCQHTKHSTNKQIRSGNKQIRSGTMADYNVGNISYACPSWAPILGFMGIASAVVFASE
jgi:hypothetical protein